jgi:hypothetical protein
MSRKPRRHDGLRWFSAGQSDPALHADAGAESTGIQTHAAAMAKRERSRCAKAAQGRLGLLITLNGKVVPRTGFEPVLQP